jgi:hypothetical protein
MQYVLYRISSGRQVILLLHQLSKIVLSPWLQFENVLTQKTSLVPLLESTVLVRLVQLMQYKQR